MESSIKKLNSPLGTRAIAVVCQQTNKMHVCIFFIATDPLNNIQHNNKLRTNKALFCRKKVCKMRSYPHNINYFMLSIFIIHFLFIFLKTDYYSEFECKHKFKNTKSIPISKSIICIHL